MKYHSTRDKNLEFTAAEAILQGLSRDGGLFVPDTFPRLRSADIEMLQKMTYPQRATSIMELFLPEFTRDELYAATKAAYGADRYDSPHAAPVVKLDADTYALELWHGPTCAFKDMALQMLPRLFSLSLDKTGEKNGICILVATSGDTGKAALEGFRDAERCKIMVFYPRDGVSDVQKLQMTTQEGGNVNVVAVNGNFDDAQSGVKAIFGDEIFRAELAQNGWSLSSANSINWGRLLPQIAYYISAYCDVVAAGEIEVGDAVDFCVPTGNFGNILAGYYARKMGLPIYRLICASNSNDVLTEFLNTGVYDRNREFFTTVSPSMDILISSNLERLLFDLSGRDDAQVREWMTALSADGKYDVGEDLLGHLHDLFAAGMCTDDETREIIGRVFRERGYLLDTHTAVAYGVLEKTRAQDEIYENTKTIIVSTASPFKFGGSVLSALGGDASSGDGFAQIDRLETLSHQSAPAPLKSLRGKNVRFTDAVEKDEMLDAVRAFLSER